MPRKLLLLGHRGARRYAPENTLAAFDLALEHGADGFEFDVRCTRDHHTILCHDPKFNRLTLRRSTLKQVQQICAKADEMPSCLEDVLDRYRTKAFLNIELKVRGLEPEVVRVIRNARPRNYFVSSFLPGVIRRLHELDRSLVLGTLAQTRWQLRRWRRMPADYIVPHYRLISPELIEKVHKAGKMLITWTVNDAVQMRRLAAMGVDGVISDDTKLLVKILGA